MSTVIAIVGRPNVGKSRLFNRLTERGDAIVHGEPGVTRDRQYGRGAHRGAAYTVVDTGGLVPDPDEDVLERMQRQADIAIEEADAVVFVLDARSGLVPADRRIAERLRQSETPVVFAVNKVDPGTDPDQMLAEFWELGSDLVPISAEHDRGIEELLDEIVPDREAAAEEDVDDGIARCAVVGKPNVGKSTLVNNLLGQERLVTSAEPGTTRDSVDTTIEREGGTYQFIDTAGLRRKSNVEEGLEELSVVHAIKSIDRADVALLMLEAPAGVTNQDKKIADVVINRECACILLINKWDAIERHEDTGDLYRRYLNRELEFLDWAPTHFISARTGRGLDRIFESVDEAYENYCRRIDTSPLNDFLEAAVARHSPPVHKGREVKLYYGTQASTRPPTFVFFTNAPEGVDESYERYLENRLREAYQFRGTPIEMHIRKRD